jgi:hypothetical protein
MTFQLDHHNRILTILNSLNSHLLEESKAYFGGGTLLTLDFGEYRWSLRDDKEHVRQVWYAFKPTPVPKKRLLE